MAVLTRFISSPNAQPGINQVRASGDAWAAADNAAMQGAEHVGNAFNRMIGSLQQSMSVEEKADPLYVAQAKADLQIQLNDGIQKARSKAQPNGTFQDETLGVFDGIAKPFIDNAPNAKTQEQLIKDFIGLRSKTYLHGKKTQEDINYQYDVNAFQQTANGLQGLAVQQPTPENINNVRGQISNLSQQMIAKGYDPKQINALTDNTLKSLETNVAMKESVSNPAATIEKLNTGAYSHLGPVQEATLRTRAESQFKAQLADLNKQNEEITKRIINDQALPADTASTLQKAGAISKYHPEAVTPFKQTAALQQFAESMRTQPITAQRNELINLATHAKNDPEMSAKLLEDMHKVLNNNIKSMQDDPLGYVAKHGLADLRPLPSDFSPRDPQKQAELQDILQSRRLATATAQTVTGQDAIPLTKGEIEGFSQSFIKASPVEKKEYLAGMSKFGADIAPAIAANLSKTGKYDSLAVGMQRYSVDPAMVATMLEGDALLSSDGTMKKATTDDRRAAVGPAQSVFPEDPALQQQILHAADAYRAGLGDSTLNTKHVEKAAGIISAGAYFGGYNTIAPKAGMSRSDFNAAVDKLTLDDLIKYGNGTPAYGVGSIYDPSTDPVSNYKVMPADLGSGQYYIVRNGKALKTDDGQVYKLNFRKFVG